MQHVFLIRCRPNTEQTRSAFLKRYLRRFFSRLPNNVPLLASYKCPALYNSWLKFPFLFPTFFPTHGPTSFGLMVRAVYKYPSGSCALPNDGDQANQYILPKLWIRKETQKNKMLLQLFYKYLYHQKDRWCKIFLMCCGHHKIFYASRFFTSFKRCRNGNVCICFYVAATKNPSVNATCVNGTA